MKKIIFPIIILFIVLYFLLSNVLGNSVNTELDKIIDDFESQTNLDVDYSSSKVEPLTQKMVVNNIVVKDNYGTKILKVDRVKVNQFDRENEIPHTLSVQLDDILFGGDEIPPLNEISLDYHLDDRSVDIDELRIEIDKFTYLDFSASLSFVEEPVIEKLGNSLLEKLSGQIKVNGFKMIREYDELSDSDISELKSLIKSDECIDQFGIDVCKAFNKFIGGKELSIYFNVNTEDRFGDNFSVYQIIDLLKNEWDNPNVVELNVSNE